MLVEVIAVHPAVTIIKTETDQHEVPTSWFSVTPKIGQQWNLQLDSVKTRIDQYALLNQYLSRG